LTSVFSEVISIDRAQVYKPSRRADALGPEILKVRLEDVLFVSLNWWDVWGANSFGFNVFWCNRWDTAVDFTPDLVILIWTRLPHGLA